MKSIKDIRKEIGYLEFKYPYNEDIIIIPIFSVKKNKNCYIIESKNHEFIDLLYRYSNFNDKDNYLVSTKPIKYGLILHKKRKGVIDFGDINCGFLTNLIELKNSYSFTLTK